jgi:hypothetical protein
MLRLRHAWIYVLLFDAPPCVGGIVRVPPATSWNDASPLAYEIRYLHLGLDRAYRLQNLLPSYVRITTAATNVRRSGWYCGLQEEKMLLLDQLNTTPSPLESTAFNLLALAQTTEKRPASCGMVTRSSSVGTYPRPRNA